MKLADLRCADCDSDDLIAFWPGKEDVQLEMFRLIPGRPVRGWCEQCWIKRFGPTPRLPPRNSRKVSAEQR